MKYIVILLLILLAMPLVQTQAGIAPKWTYTYPLIEPVNDVDITSNGRVVAGIKDGTVLLLENKNEIWNKNLGDIEGKKVVIEKVSTTADGSYIVVSGLIGSTRNLYLLSGSDGSIIKKISFGAEDKINDVAVTSEGPLYVVVSTYNTIYKYDANLQLVKKYQKLLNFDGVDITPYGKFVVAATQEGILLLDENLAESWKYTTPSITGTGGNAQFYKVSISLDGEKIVGSIDKGRVFFIKNNQVLNRGDFSGQYITDVWKSTQEYSISSLDTSRSGMYTVLGTNSGDQVNYRNWYGGRIYFLKDSTPLWKYDLSAWVSGAAVSPDGRYIAASSGKNIYFFENSVTLDTTAKSKVVVLANSIDAALASDFFKFLENEGIEVVKTNAQDFSKYMGEKFIVILGGPDAPEGVGDIVQQVLTNEEQNYLRTKYNRVSLQNFNQFTKTNVFNYIGNKIFVIAGSGRDQTKAAHFDVRGEVATKVKAG